MVSLSMMSFFRHLPNCVCSKCGNERYRFIIGKKVEGKVVSKNINIEEFNSQVVERYDVLDKKFHYRGKFLA